MHKNKQALAALAVALAAHLAAPLTAPAQASTYQLEPSPPAAGAAQEEALAQFTPRPTDTDREIDYSIWGYALKSVVVGMGPSVRKGAPRPREYTGTRLNRGHKSRLRLEGSRIAYTFFTDEVTASFTEYRQDLERVGTELGIASLSRNEQLAFWLNLHNVAIIEQIARHYPEILPSRIQIDGEFLDEARFIEVAGVKLSPKDIRTRIVYPNWSDPRVVYGFFRGDIGGPMIQPEEFNARNLDFLLGDNAAEFVNSLRGVERRGKTLLVSKIYEEAAPFYYADLQSDLPVHLARFADDKVATHLTKASKVKYTRYEGDIADLARAQRQPFVSNLEVWSPMGRASSVSSRVPLNIVRYMEERRQKLDYLERRGVPIWTVRVVPIDLPGEPSSVVEID
ncbi:MAG: DUF547 domain-containing protein [Pseudomonadota bacterium]